MDDFPEWARRHLLAEALGALGLPWVPWAWYRRPRDTMTLGQRLQAVAMEGRVVDEARRRLPPGACGSMLNREWRDGAWRCIVAGLALLDDEERSRLVADALSEQEPEPVIARNAEPRREPTVPPPAAAPVKFRIFREGEVPHAS